MTSLELIGVIESEEQYTPEAIKAAQQALDDRRLIPSSVLALAKTFWREYCKDNFRSLVGLEKPPKSKFLKAADINELMKEAYEYHRERRELFEIDITKYWAPIF